MAIKTYVVVGLGQFGEHVARRLSEAGHDVLGLDKDMGRVETLKDVVPRVARADCTSENAMKAMGVGEAEMAVMALGEEDFEAAVLGTAVLKGLGVKTVVARSSSPQRGRILSLAGASRVVYPEAEMGEQLAQTLLHSNVAASVGLPSGFSLVELKAPKTVAGKSIQELQLRQTHQLNVVAIQRGGKVRDPEPGFALEEGDMLLLAGRSGKIDSLARLWE
jgi:trk system potassium uptake protein